MTWIAALARRHLGLSAPVALLLCSARRCPLCRRRWSDRFVGPGCSGDLTSSRPLWLSSFWHRPLSSCRSVFNLPFPSRVSLLRETTRRSSRRLLPRSRRTRLTFWPIGHDDEPCVLDEPFWPDFRACFGPLSTTARGTCWMGYFEGPARLSRAPVCTGARGQRRSCQRYTAPPALWRRRRWPQRPARSTHFAFSRLESRWNCGVNSALSNRYTPMASNISSAVA